MLENGGGTYRNYSGCGNTLNGNHPIVREMIFHCLRHWVHNYHVDGFRFDLASILSRDRDGELVPNPPVVESIAEDPLLADTKIIAEAWDAAGGVSGGHVRQPALGRMERPLPRRRAPLLARRSAHGRRRWPRGWPAPATSTSRAAAGRTTASTSSPRTTASRSTTWSATTTSTTRPTAKDNRDGDNNNYSYNYGVEGPTRRAADRDVRLRQIKNMLATLLLSQGVPMLLAGDECRRTQRGNNNAYCQDNDISWFDWKLVEKHEGLRRFCQALIAFRKAEPTVRQTNFLRGQPRRPGGLPDVSWFAPAGQPSIGTPTRAA